MQETIVVEAVSNKPKFPKFNSGAILAGGTWINVVKDLPISNFQKGTEMTVEIETNAKGYKSITGLVEEVVAPPSPRTTLLRDIPTTIAGSTTSYDDRKNRRILVQGITQACLTSPSLTVLPMFTTTAEIAKHVKALALEMIDFVDSQA
jgi:hypothetical protein